MNLLCNTKHRCDTQLNEIRYNKTSGRVVQKHSNVEGGIRMSSARDNAAHMVAALSDSNGNA